MSGILLMYLVDMAFLQDDFIIETENQRVRPGGSEVERLLADNRLAREILGWEPRAGLEDGLKRTIEWIKQHSERYRSGVYVV